MYDLLPFEAYELPFVGPMWRTALAMSVLWGVPMSFVAVVVSYRTTGLLLPLSICLVGSLGFGFLWTRTFRRRMRTLMRRLYDVDPALVPGPPPGTFRCRVSCGLAISQRMTVGGHLYAGPGSWVFVPHQKNLRKHRSPTVISIAEDLILTPHTVAPSGTARLFANAVIESLEVGSAGQSTKLYVPDPERVAARLRECSEKTSPHAPSG